MYGLQIRNDEVSTHSRLKAAGKAYQQRYKQDDVSTHSRLKAAGWVIKITVWPW